jgi:hypothetical protein
VFGAVVQVVVRGVDGHPGGQHREVVEPFRRGVTGPLDELVPTGRRARPGGELRQPGGVGGRQGEAPALVGEGLAGPGRREEPGRGSRLVERLPRLDDQPGPAGGAGRVREVVQQPAADPAPAVRRGHDELGERDLRVVERGQREHRDADGLPGAGPGEPGGLDVPGIGGHQPRPVLDPARRRPGGHVVFLRRGEHREPVAQRAFVVGCDGVEGDGDGEFDHTVHSGTDGPAGATRLRPPGPVPGGLLG